MNQRPYRIVPRAKAAWICAALLAVSAIIAWYVTRKINASSADTGALFDQSAEAGALEIVRRVHFYAWIYGGSLLAIALWLAWKATRTIRSQCSPPPGAWIIEGHRTHVGTAALRRGRILLSIAGVLALLAAGMFVSLWRLAATIGHPVP